MGERKMCSTTYTSSRERTYGVLGARVAQRQEQLPAESAVGVAARRGVAEGGGGVGRAGNAGAEEEEGQGERGGGTSSRDRHLRRSGVGRAEAAGRGQLAVTHATRARLY